MAGVSINTGPVSHFSKPWQIPPEKWRDLMRAKRDFMKSNIKYDCSCLLEFIDQAGEMWQVLGFQSVDEMIRIGYELNPEEIDLAVRWLRIKDPQIKISLPDAVEKGRALAAKAKEVPILNPNGVKDSHDKTENIRAEKEYGTSATYRIAKLKRDCPEVAVRMEQGEFRTVAEAERAAGLGKPLLSEFDRILRQFERLSPADQSRFCIWLKQRRTH